MLLKGQNSKYFRFAFIWPLYNHSALPLQLKSYIDNIQTNDCNCVKKKTKKLLFTKTWDQPVGCSLLTSGLSFANSNQHSWDPSVLSSKSVLFPLSHTASYEWIVLVFSVVKSSWGNHKYQTEHQIYFSSLSLLKDLEHLL